MRRTIADISALSAAALLGDVAFTAGIAGAVARRAGLLGGFLVGFFAAFLRTEEPCFFRVVWEVESIGDTASAATRRTARALSLVNIESCRGRCAPR